MSDTGEQQQQQQPGDAPAPFDLTPALAGLSADNKTAFERKGWIKDGKFAIDINGVGDSYRGVEKLVGGKTLLEPQFDTPENFDKWDGWDKMGVPAKAEDYKFERPQMPDGVPYDEAAETKARAWALKSKMPNMAFQRFMTEAVADRIASATQAAAANSTAIKEQDAKLHADWGANYPAHVAQSREAFEYFAKDLKMAPAEMADSLNKLVGDPMTLALFDRLGELLGEGVIKGGKEAGFAQDKAAAEGQLNTLMQNPDFVKSLTDKAHVNHASNVATRNRLNAQIHGG